LRIRSLHLRSCSSVVPAQLRSPIFRPSFLRPPKTSGGGGHITAGEEFNFGPVLARGQVLRHSFTFTNTSHHQIRLTEATAFAPCCSEVGPVSTEPIPPGGQRRIPAVLKFSTEKAEEKRATFVVRTNSNERPTINYALRAAIYPEWETKPLGEPLPRVSRGRSGRQFLRIITRRALGKGEELPDEVISQPGLVATFTTEATDEAHSDSLFSSSRDVGVVFPASTDLGLHRGQLTFRWPDGRVREHQIHWMVTPALQLSPSRMAVASSDPDITHTFVVRSDGRAFRVLRVEPRELLLSSDFVPEVGITHEVKIRLNFDRVAREKGATISIYTDHPDQSTIELPVVVLNVGA